MKPLDQYLGGLLPRSAMGLLHDIYDIQLPFAPISGHRIFKRVRRVACSYREMHVHSIKIKQSNHIYLYIQFTVVVS